MEHKAKDERRLIVAGLTDWTLGRYLESYAVDNVSPAHRNRDRTLRRQIGTRAGTVHDVCGGLHSRERPILGMFKDSLVSVLCKCWRGARYQARSGRIVKARRPTVRCRLIGAKLAAGGKPAAVPNALE